MVITGYTETAAAPNTHALRGRTSSPRFAASSVHVSDPSDHGGSIDARPARRPVVAVTIGVERAQWGAGWDGPAAMLPIDYVRSIRRAGGMPILVPPDGHLADDPDEILDVADAVLFAGGADISPTAYGQSPSPHLEGIDAMRDRVELAIMRRALERDVPVLGICRGLQLLAIATGGTLHQHLPDLVGHEHHRRSTGTFVGNRHRVDLTAGSQIAAIEEATSVERASHHHQGVDTLGDGVRVTGRCPVDGLPEAIEVSDHPFALAVQWHPEVEEECSPIRALVGSAVTRRWVRS